MKNIIPFNIQIETVAGKCTVSCNMCPIEQHPRKEIMSDELFDKIVGKLLKIKKNIKFFNLVGIGEPLLDKNTNLKIEKCKKLGFQNVCIYTNGTALNKKNSLGLLNAKLDVLVVSLDGFKKSQEKIRVGANYDKIEKNIINFINLRDNFYKEHNHYCKVIIRFTEQRINFGEFEDFKNFWLKHLTISSEDKDLILRYKVHSHGDLVNISNISNENLDFLKDLNFTNCPELEKRLSIHSNGKIGLCCGDHHEKYNNPSILDEDIISIYNSGNFKLARDSIKKKKYLDICKNCSVPFSIESKEVAIS